MVYVCACVCVSTAREKRVDEFFRKTKMKTVYKKHIIKDVLENRVKRH